MRTPWFLWSLAYFALQLGTPLITLPKGWLLIGGVLLTTLLLMATLLGLVFAWAHETEKAPWLAPVMLVGGVGAWWLWGLVPFVLGWSRENPPAEVMFGVYRAVHGYLLMLAAVGLGATLSKLIREKNLLAPVIPFAAMVDMLTVLTPGGFVKQVMEKAPEIAERASVAVMAAPNAPEAVARLTPIAIIGAGDFIFLALYAACLIRFSLRVRATMIGLFVALWVYLGVVLWVLPALGVAPRLPALVPMAIVTLAINWRAFQLSRQETVASVVVTTLALGIIAWLFTQGN
ncbi:MAG: hypothetical protein KatS3mg016_1163 [Fimbriimonadales bacterium]|nr:MAG: hypothetical protein KatS3mg016_1163 [Fimbriimonadales bacterium]